MIENTLLGNKTIIHSEYLEDNILSLQDRTFVFPEEFQYKVVEVTEPFIARMDLISQQMYNTPNYSDFLCKINGISNPFELNEGDLLVIPEVMELYKFAAEDINMGEETDRVGVGMNNVNPQAKKKTDKRSPNEAIIGDKRYNIDSSRKVIVY